MNAQGDPFVTALSIGANSVISKSAIRRWPSFRSNISGLASMEGTIHQKT
jgi:hypothetical protein